MSISNLLNNLNSDYLSAFADLQPKSAPRRVVVYVESDEDISFWRVILNQFENKEIAFDILLPSSNSLKKGKIAALEKDKDLLNISTGSHLIVCIDSDYDYLLQNKTELSKKINSSKFIFQTYSYSIENLLSYSECLHTLCVQSTKNDKKLIDYTKLLESYSKIIHELFVWSVYFRVKEDFNSLNLTAFCNIVKILEIGDLDNSYEYSFTNLELRVNTKLEELKASFPNEIVNVDSLSLELGELGLKSNNTYLFAQGHTIKKNVILMFLKDICNKLRNEKIAFITQNAIHNTEKQNQIDAYKKQVVEIEMVLNNNTDYKSCFLYSKIHRDLEIYFEEFFISNNLHR